MAAAAGWAAWRGQRGRGEGRWAGGKERGESGKLGQREGLGPERISPFLFLRTLFFFLISFQTFERFLKSNKFKLLLRNLSNFANNFFTQMQQANYDAKFG